MKKIIIIVGFLLTSFFSDVYAGGGITHMFIARAAIDKLPDAQLRHLLLDNLDAYLVGAVYPDSGYVDGTHYGEDSHWDPFIYAFASYLNEKYADPATENPKLVAFLFGCAVHRISDEVMHWTFYPIMKDKDFKGDGNAAHHYGDVGIDLLLTLDKNQWLTEPTWWVPVTDLVAIYHKMGKDQYSAKEIIWGNSVLSLAGIGEKMIAAPAYPILKWKMSWTAANYYAWPVGGILMDAEKVAAYETNLWQRLKDKSIRPIAAQSSSASYRAKDEHRTTEMSANHFAKEALQSGTVNIAIVTNEDGSIELQHPIVKRALKFRTLIIHLIAKLTK